MRTLQPTRGLTRLIVLMAACGTYALASAPLASSANAVSPLPIPTPPVAPPGTPDLSQMGPQPSDFAPGAHVVKQGYELAGASLGIIGYERKLADAGIVGGARFAEVAAEVVLTPSVEVATATFAVLDAELRSPIGRKLTRTKTIQEYGRRRVRPRDIKFASTRSLGVGNESIVLPWSVRVRGVLHRDDAIRLRVDRVVESLELTGAPGGRVSFAEVVGFAGKMANRIRAGLSPLNSVAPVIGGMAVHGQTLVASNGTWSNGATIFVYQWERCDATGANCAPIAGASGQSYTLTAADVAATVRVSVTATSGPGLSTTATSTPSVVVQ
jgi:hypothetical protein